MSFGPELDAHRRRLHPELGANLVELVPPREELRVGVRLDLAMVIRVICHSDRLNSQFSANNYLAVVEEGSSRQETSVEHGRVDDVHALKKGPDSRVQNMCRLG